MPRTGRTDVSRHGELARTHELLYLGRAEVAALLPDPEAQVELVADAFRAAHNGSAELPLKPGIRPRPNGFIHAMPAYLVADDVAAIKWVAGYRGNRERGLPYISALIVLNDPSTGLPRAVIDGAEITAVRTAAASLLCIERFAPRDARRVAILGCGEQARYHARLLTALRPDLTLVGYDVHPERIEVLGPGAVAASTARDAVADADIVVTAGPLLDEPKPPLRRAWLGERWLLLPLDYDSYVAADVAAAADLLLCDHLAQFEYYRGLGRFAGWPVPDGDVLADIPPADRVLCCNLGVATLDAAFGDYVFRQAVASGAGRWLPL